MVAVYPEGPSSERVYSVSTSTINSMLSLSPGTGKPPLPDAVKVQLPATALPPLLSSTFFSNVSTGALSGAIILDASRLICPPSHPPCLLTSTHSI